MNCIICNSESNFFFKKEFDGLFKTMLASIEYAKCKNCGFTFSPTIFNLSDEEFSRLNITFHQYLENPSIKKNINQPPYVEQATMLTILEKNKLIDLSSSLDFAGGYGTLNKILKKYFSCPPFLIYDPYMQDLNNIDYIFKENLKQYNTVFTSAIFEHVRNRETLEEINSCVAKNGILIIHTVICENIPNDANWFYLNPVHCAFHTNKSMEILMKQWDYKWSLYCPSAKSWILFKNEIGEIVKIIEAINEEFQTNYFHYKSSGFLDYWKGF